MAYFLFNFSGSGSEREINAREYVVTVLLELAFDVVTLRVQLGVSLRQIDGFLFGERDGCCRVLPERFDQALDTVRKCVQLLLAFAGLRVKLDVFPGGLLVAQEFAAECLLPLFGEDSALIVSLHHFDNATLIDYSQPAALCRIFDKLRALPPTPL